MTLFWGLAGIMLVAALLFTVPWLLRSQKYSSETDLDTLNTEVIRAQLAELEADLRTGRLAEAQYLAARQDLERELLEDLSHPPAANAATGSRSGRWAALLLVLLIPGAAMTLYDLVGTREIIPLLSGPQAARQAATPANGTHSIEEMVEALAQRLREEPDNADGWRLLARSYSSMQRFGDAAVAYEKARSLAGDEPGLLADYVDALVIANGGQFTGQAGELLQKALAKGPGNVKVLWLAGHWRYGEGAYTEAIDYWERAAAGLPPGGKDASMISQQIRQARSRLGSAVPEPAQAASQTPAEPAVERKSAVGSAITVKVTLDPGLREAVSAEDTVFIFARAAEGPRMPLAIVRKQARDLPITATLDDSMAMSPAMVMSNFPQLALGARISKSGNAMPQSGDLRGLVTPVTADSAQPVELTIDSRIP